MAKELKALPALLKDPSSSPSTHMAADTVTLSPGDLTLSYSLHVQREGIRKDKSLKNILKFAANHILSERLLCHFIN